MIEMLLSGVVQGVLNAIGLPTILFLIAAWLFGRRIIADASKPVIAVAMLLLMGFAAWYYWPSSTVKSDGVRFPPFQVNAPAPPAPESTAAPSKLPVASPRQPVAPPQLPVARPGFTRPPQPTYAQRHAPAIVRLEAARKEKMKLNPSYYTPEARAARLSEWVAKEKERQRKAALAAAEETERRRAEAEHRRLAAMPPPIITPDQARELRMQMVERRNVQAQASLRESQQRMLARWGKPQTQTPTLIGGGDGRTYR